MAILNIYTQGHPILKKKAKAVSKVTPAHLKLIKGMIETMKAAPGIGLAAPQVGVSERIIVIDNEKQIVCLINPKIVSKSGKQTFIEGCLSVPGLEAPVERYASIRVKALDKTGKPVTIDAEGLFAVIIQHETDHLDGVLFIDRVKDPKEIKIKSAKKEETL